MKDTGCGVSKKDIEQVFDKFYKRHLAIVGVGVSLPVSRRKRCYDNR